jgi:hypothetical protein
LLQAWEVAAEPAIQADIRFIVGYDAGLDGHRGDVTLAGAGVKGGWGRGLGWGRVLGLLPFCQHGAAPLAGLNGGHGDSRSRRIAGGGSRSAIFGGAQSMLDASPSLLSARVRVESRRWGCTSRRDGILMQLAALAGA